MSKSRFTIPPGAPVCARGRPKHICIAVGGRGASRRMVSPYLSTLGDPKTGDARGTPFRFLPMYPYRLSSPGVVSLSYPSSNI